MRHTALQAWDRAVFSARPFSAWLGAVVYVALEAWEFARSEWRSVRDCYHITND